MLVLLGDFNARINYEEGQVKPTSPNGKLMYELLDDYNLKLGNLSPSTVGEWTRIQKIKNHIHKSRIDYVVLHEDTLPLMEKMIIDEEKIHCPYRERKTKNGKNITFADHCPILLSLQVRASCHHVPTSSRKVWNFSDDGYVHYKEHSKHPMKVTWNACTTTAHENWTNQFEKVLHLCFSKRTIKLGSPHNKVQKSNLPVRNMLSKLARKGKLQRKIARQYLLRVIEIETRQHSRLRAIRLHQTMASLTDGEKFTPTGYWKMKRAADKNVKIPTTYTVMKENGVEVSGSKAIKEAYSIGTNSNTA